jgi:hypothetical protein
MGEPEKIVMKNWLHTAFVEQSIKHALPGKRQEVTVVSI